MDKLQRTAEKLRSVGASALQKIRALNPRTVFSLVVALMMVPLMAEASVASVVMMFLARTLQGIVGFFGELLVSLVDVLTAVAQYNDFVTAKAVGIGWVLVRDVTNMFFVLILLLVAFGTIVGHSEWNYKNKTVNKLIVAAIVINFSRTIVGLMIDFSQVIMLTFVAGFKAAAGGNFANAFRINKMLEAGKSEGGNDPDTAASAMQIVAAYLLALAMLIISASVMIWMIVALVVRMVYLWLLTVLSPMAFFLRVVPGQKGKFDKWWTMLMTQLTFGPVMAFFLWLSLAAVAAQPNLGVSGGAGSAESTVDPAEGASSGAFASDELQSFIIAVALLVGGVKMAEEMAGETGKFASGIVGKPMDRAKQVGKALGGATAYAAGQIKLPTFSKDKDGKYKYATASSLIYAGTEKMKSTGLAKAMSKEGREQKSMEQKVQALEATGQKEKAAALKEELLGKAGKGLPKGKSELVGIMKQDIGSTKSKAAALKLAEGGNLEMSDIKEVSKGDKTLEKLLTSASAKSGKKQLMGVEAENYSEARPQVQKMWDNTAHAGEKNKLIDEAINGYMLGPDGMPRDANAAAMLLSVDDTHFQAMNDGKKKSLMDALEFVRKNIKDYEADTTLRASMEADIVRQMGSLVTHMKAGSPPPSDADARAAMDARNIKENGIVVAAAGVNNTYKSYDLDSGNITKPEELSNFQALVSSNSKTRKSVLKSLDANMLMANGGDNDVARTMLEHTTEKDLIDLLGDPDIPRDKMFALKQAAEKFSAKERSAAGPMGPLSAAGTNAENIAKLGNDWTTPLGAAFDNRSFKTEARQWVIQAGAGAVSGAVKAAAVYQGVPAVINMAQWAAAPALSGTITGGLATAAKAVVGKKAIEAGQAITNAAAGAATAVGQTISDLSTKAVTQYAKDLGSKISKGATRVGRTVRYGVPRKGTSAITDLI